MSALILEGDTVATDFLQRKNKPATGAGMLAPSMYQMPDFAPAPQPVAPLPPPPAPKKTSSYDPYSMNRRGVSAPVNPKTGLPADFSGGSASVYGRVDAPAKASPPVQLLRAPEDPNASVFGDGPGQLASFLPGGERSMAGRGGLREDAMPAFATNPLGTARKADSTIDMAHQYAEPAAAPIAARRNEAAQMRGNQVATIGIAGEDERKLQMTLDSIMSRPARNGSARRAQAEMFGAVVDRAKGKDAIEHDRHKNALDRDQNAAKTNMASGDEFADRQLKADLGNTEAGLKRRELDVNAGLKRDEIAAERAKAEAAGQPTQKDLMEMTKLGYDIEALKNNQTMKGEEHDAGIMAKQDAAANAEIAAMVKTGGMTEDQARVEYTRRQNAAGNDLRTTSVGREVDNSMLQAAGDAMNKGTSSSADMFYGGSARMGDDMEISDEQRQNLRWDQFEANTPDTFPNKARKFFGQPQVTRVQYKGDGTGPKSGMDLPHALYNEDDALVKYLQSKRRTPPSGR